MKNTQKKVAAATPANTGSRYSELKTMLDDRRRPVHGSILSDVAPRNVDVDQP